MLVRESRHELTPLRPAPDPNEDLMRKSTLGVTLLAGLAVSGGGAFTAANDMSAVTGGTKNVGGFGTATVTGATVTNVSYTVDPLTLDNSKVSAIVFTATENLTGKTAKLTLKNAGENVTAPNTCAVTFLTTSSITCTFTSPVAFSAFDGEALAVYQ